ncbi:MAG TPA: 50S ribosomal protein L21 [Chthoniobacteraceae bacterium]|nr:50S ribosomal protein L21 [Chthoniobacteraceae bacterium]
MAYAIIKAGGKQYKVAKGDVIEVDRLAVEAGKDHKISDVLFYSDGKDSKHGADALKGASVAAEVVGEKKGEKKIAYKYRRRKGYHRTVGHRSKLTQLKIKSITA